MASVAVDDSGKTESVAFRIRQRNAGICKRAKQTQLALEESNSPNRNQSASTDGLLAPVWAANRKSSKANPLSAVFNNENNLLIPVALMDGSSTKQMFATGKKTTTQDVIDRMASACGLSAKATSACALWIHEQALELLLKPHYEPYRVRKQWQEIMYTFTRRPKDVPCAPRFEFRKNCFLTKEAEMAMEDPAFNILLYTEARYNVISCLYPCTETDAVQLAGIDAQLAFGDCDTSIAPEDMFHNGLIKQIIPRFLIARKSTEEWAKLLRKTHAHHAGRRSEELQALYINYCRQWGHYGSTWFYGRACNEAKEVIEQDAPTELIRIGVNYEGIHLINHVTNSVMITSHLDQIAWYASELDKLLYIEHGNPDKPRKISIITPQARIIETMILRFLALARPGDTRPNSPVQCSSDKVSYMTAFSEDDTKTLDQSYDAQHTADSNLQQSGGY